MTKRVIRTEFKAYVVHDLETGELYVEVLKGGELVASNTDDIKLWRFPLR